MARTTTNLSLRVWDLSSDHFNHTQLADNWDKLDAHDHTTTKGKQIPSGGLEAGAVTATKLATDAVTTTAISNNAVTNAKLADASVGTAEIIDGNVTIGKLAAPVSWSPTFVDMTGFVTGGTNQLYYIKDAIGNVFFGVYQATVGASNISPNTTFFTLPTGFRPFNNYYSTLFSHGGASGALQLCVDSGGHIFTPATLLAGSIYEFSGLFRATV